MMHSSFRSTSGTQRGQIEQACVCLPEQVHAGTATRSNIACQVMPKQSHAKQPSQQGDMVQDSQTKQFGRLCRQSSAPNTMNTMHSLPTSSLRMVGS